MSNAPTLNFERELMADGIRFVAGMDEVGRGALAGPVSVGLVVVDASAHKPLAGVKDSKLLKAAERERLVPLIQSWAVAYGVGHASALEIDELGLTTALRLAGYRAWTAAVAQSVDVPETVILDGSFNWLDGDEPDIFAALHPELAEPVITVPVRTLVKADMTCLSVAAASVLAKVERDGLMSEYAVNAPEFGWPVNKGYATAGHRSAIEKHGPSQWHRKTWRLTSNSSPASNSGQNQAR